MDEIFWNEEDDFKIICPYCGEKYEPSYEDTIIGNQIADCYSDEEEQIFRCDTCGKKFTMTPHLSSWKYRTETIDGEMTEDEWEENWESAQKLRKWGV